MSSLVTGLNQASRNANDGISLAQLAEGSLNQDQRQLTTRIRELAVQAPKRNKTQLTISTQFKKEVNQRFRRDCDV